jgi:hypothetical protein
MYWKSGDHHCPTFRVFVQMSSMSQRLSPQSSAPNAPPLLQALCVGYMACFPSAAQTRCQDLVPKLPCDQKEELSADDVQCADMNSCISRHWLGSFFAASQLVPQSNPSVSRRASRTA